MSTAKVSELIRPAAPKGDFNVFCSSHYHTAQIAIKIVERRDVIERGATPKSRAGLPLGMLEIQPIRAEPVVAYVA
jgi:hypothetical protein